MESKRRIIPPLYLLLSLCKMSALHVALPIIRIVPPRWSYLGGIVVVIGAVISGIAVNAFRLAGSPV